jgi:DNA-binding MarR family transcriptional regulator
MKSICGGLIVTMPTQSKTNQSFLYYPDIDLELRVLLDHANVVITRIRELELAQYNISLEHAAILVALQNKSGTATIAEIVNRTLRKYNATTTLINRMVRAGLVEKQESPTSKKQVIVITPKGKSILANMSRVSIKMVFEIFPDEDKAKFAGYLRQLLDKGREMLCLDQKLPFLQE